MHKDLNTFNSTVNIWYNARKSLDVIYAFFNVNHISFQTRLD